MSQGMSKRGRIAAAFAAGAMSVGVLAACSSSGGSGGGSTTTAPFNETTAKQQITTNWTTFFDPTKDVTAKAALLQDATTLQPVLTANAADPQAKTTKALVKQVVIDPSHTSAVVTYDLIPAAGGTALLPGATGKAVLDAGVWKVSKASFCGLIALGAQAKGTAAPPQCAGS
jgi:hypothetical protein